MNQNGIFLMNSKNTLRRSCVSTTMRHVEICTRFSSRNNQTHSVRHDCNTYAQGNEKEGGDRVVVPWYQRGGTWYNILQVWWNLVPKVGVSVPSLYESVPIKISSMDNFGIPRTNF